MDNTTIQTPGVSKSKWGGYGCAFFFCLMFLIGGAIPALLSVPGLQARFTGRETTALVTADVSCSWTDANNNVVTGYDYEYTFTGSSGKVYRITDTSCGSGPDTIGTRETIWYQPAHPTHFLTANAWTFDWLFFLGFSIPMLLFAFAFFRRLLRRLFAPSRWFTEVQMRHSIPLLLLFLLGLLLTACSGQTGASSPPPKVSRFDAQAAIASYVGKWEVHGALLTITSNRTGLENWNVGPCTQPLTDNTPLCNGNAKITFTVNADGSIKGTFQSVWYTQWSDAPVPAGFHTDPENPQAGDTFELKHVKAHLLYTTWFGRLSTHNSYNRYWCDSSTSPADRPLCGA